MRRRFQPLDIYDPRERLAIRAADIALDLGLLPSRLLPRRPPAPLRRILLLRLERIGDLLMSLAAIRSGPLFAPDAEIDLIVGPWNEQIGRLIPEVTRVDVLATPWLSRGASALPTTASPSGRCHGATATTICP